jgi:predicted DNA-binding transcriptional regulator AlpA
MIENKLLVRSRDAAKMLAISEKTLWNMSQPRGPLPVIRVGRAGVRYSLRALEAWIGMAEKKS